MSNIRFSGGNVGIGVDADTNYKTLIGGAAYTNLFLQSTTASTPVIGLQHNGSNAVLLRNNVYRSAAGTDVQVDTTKCAWDINMDCNTSTGNFTIRRSASGSGTPTFSNYFYMSDLGNVGINGSSAGSKLLVTASSTNYYANLFNGTITDGDNGVSIGSQIGTFLQFIFTPTPGSNVSAGIYSQCSMIAPSTKTITQAAQIYINPTYSSNVGTITTGYGIRVETGSAGAGTISNTYGLSVSRPTAGTNRYTAYFDTIIGIGETPNSAYALLVAGDMRRAAGSDNYGINLAPGIGSTSGTVTNALAMNIYPNYGSNVGTVSTAIGLQVAAGATAGTITTGYSARITMPAYGSSKYGVLVDGSATVATGNFLVAFQIGSALGCSSGTLTNSAHQYIYPNYSQNSATISNAYGLWVDSGATAGTITNGYGLLVARPSFGSNKYTAYFDNGVGIAVANTGATHALLVTGTAGLSTGTAWTNTSDARIKKNILSLNDPLDTFSRLNPCKFQYVDEYANDHPTLDKERHYYGFIADEVEQIIPECIKIDVDSKIYNGAMIAKQELEKKLKADGVENPEVPEPSPCEGFENLKQLDIHNITILGFAAIKELIGIVKAQGEEIKMLKQIIMQ